MNPSTRRILLGIAQVVFVVAVFAYGGREIATQWREADGRLADVTLRPLPLLGATLLVLATYGLLIQLWRRVLRLWSSSLSFGDAVRIWTVSNLGRYVPLRVAQIAAMAVMARERGVSPVAATGSALINTLLNIVAGLAVAAAAGGADLLGAVERSLTGGSGDGAGLAVRGAAVIVLAAAGVLLLLPWVLPAIARLASRLLRRDVAVPPLPPGVVWLTAAGNVAAWIAYGLAFHLFVLGTVASAAGAPLTAIAVYSASYIAGYLFLPAPGGLGVRELVMVGLLEAFGVASAGDAWVIAFASRIWLTVLEVLPGLLFLALGLVPPRRSPLTSGDASP